MQWTLIVEDALAIKEAAEAHRRRLLHLRKDLLFASLTRGDKDALIERIETVLFSDEEQRASDRTAASKPD